jgi:hypothetical protein
MDAIEIVDPGASGEVVFSRFLEKWLLDIGMVTNGGPGMHFQKAPSVSNDRGTPQSAVLAARSFVDNPKCCFYRESPCSTCRPPEDYIRFLYRFFKVGNPIEINLARLIIIA